MSIFQYLLQVNLCLVLFYAFYMLLLRNETFFGLNRAYLVSTALISFGIPMLQSEWIRELFVTEQVVQVSAAISNINIYSTAQTIALPAQPIESTSWSIGDWLAAVYLLGILAYSAKMLFNLIVLFRAKRNASNQAYSFFKNIVVSKDLEERDTIYRHEEVHAVQWHSADVLLFEVIALINWFNPVVYAYKKAIRSIHEYIADERASVTLPSKEAYALLLVNNVFGLQAKQLSNSFYKPSLLKRRILMLQKSRSKKLAILKYGLSVPLFITMLVFTSATISRTETVKALDQELETSNDIPASIKELGSGLTARLTKELKSTITAFSATITGVVKDKDGNNLGPIKITNTSTNKEYVTLPNGEFSIPGYSANDVLLFQFPGFKDQSFSVAISQSEPKKYGPYTITMISDPSRAITNNGQNLIRYGSTMALSGYAKPLYIVDGIPRDGNPFDASPADISNITVLKGSGTDIYGERGKNGVVLVTTKKAAAAQSLNIKLRDLKAAPLVILNGKPVDNVPADFSFSTADQQDYSKLLNIAPEDIKNITVLKDAAAVKMFGERAKDGVLIISTKENVTKKQTATDANTVRIDDNNEVSTSVDELPQPPGGAIAWNKFIATYKLPEEAKKNGVSGRLVVSFVVEKDGSLTDIKVVRDLGFGTAEAAIELFRRSAKWKPGAQNGKPVRVAYNQSIMVDSSKR